MTMDGNTSIIPIINKLQTGTLQVYVGVFNYHLRLTEVEPLLQRVHDAHPVAFDPAKLRVPPRHVLQTIKFYLPSISNDDQSEIIKTLQAMPSNASSPHIQFTVIGQALELLQALLRRSFLLHRYHTRCGKSNSDPLP